MLGDQILQFFEGFGREGMLLALFFIFITDSTLFPMVPEFFLLVIYATNPVTSWGVTVVAIAAAAIMCGNTLLYLIVKKTGVPRFVERAMKAYSSIMIAKDEKMLLVNRIAPVLPYTGAFIAINRWDYKKSMIYIVFGGVAKFSVLVLLSGAFYIWFSRGFAQTATFMLILITIVVGVILSYMRKRSIEKKRR